MSQQVLELETILQQMLLEHHKLLAHVDAPQAAMKAFNLKAMDDAVNLQEAMRLRIATLETKRPNAGRPTRPAASDSTAKLTIATSPRSTRSAARPAATAGELKAA